MVKSKYPVKVGVFYEKSPSFFVALAYIVSILLFNLSNPLLPHILFLVWIISVCIYDNKAFSSILSRKYYLALYIFLVYYFVSSLNAFSVGTCVNRIFSFLEVISPIVMCELYSKCGNERKKIMLYVFGAVYIVNYYQMVTTLNVSAVQGLRQHVDDAGYLDTVFHFIYSLTMLLPFLLYIYRNLHSSNNHLIRIIIIIWVLSIIWIIFKSLYATAFILMCFGIVLALVYGRKKWEIKFIISVLIISVLFVYIVPYVVQQLLSINSDYGLIAYRLDDVSTVMTGGGADSNTSLGDRSNRSLISLNTFLEYPIFGVNHLSDDSRIFDAVLIGNHAEWVDSLAKYGIFAIFLFYFLIKSSIQIAQRRAVNAVFIMYAIIGFLNPLFYNVQNTICFFIIPMLYDFFINSKTISR